jgi:hypothetical protein
VGFGGAMWLSGTSSIDFSIYCKLWVAKESFEIALIVDYSFLC